MIKTLAVRLAEVKAKKVSDSLDPVQAKALVNKLAATVAEMGAKTIGGTLHDEEAKALVDRTADTPQEVKVRTDILSYGKESAGRGTVRRADSHNSRNGVREIW